MIARPEMAHGRYLRAGCEQKTGRLEKARATVVPTLPATQPEAPCAPSLAIEAAYARDAEASHARLPPDGTGS
jgi:hypothetical protein